MSCLPTSRFTQTSPSPASTPLEPIPRLNLFCSILAGIHIHDFAREVEFMVDDGYPIWQFSEVHRPNQHSPNEGYLI
jgi:hypothetical protein